MSKAKAIFQWLSPIRVGLKAGFLEMRSHKLRSILSTLGVLFGVFVMVVMLSLMGGLQSFLKEQMGAWIGSVWIWENKDIPKEKRAEFSRSPGLRLSDGPYLETETQVVDKVYKYIQRREKVDLMGKQTRVRIKGVDKHTIDSDFSIGTPIVILKGRNLSSSDFRKGAKNLVISEVIAEQLSRKMLQTGKDTSALIGSRLNIYNQRFRIVGVYGAENGSKLKWHMRKTIYMPLVAMQMYISGFDPNPGSIWLEVKDPLKMDLQLNRIVSALLARHRGVEDFEYHKPDHLNEFVKMLENVANILGLIALIALLSGGLGIMNVMLSSISERVREIGIRKAIGASHFQIFIQFITETSTLCTLGGLIGAGMGCIPLLFSEAIEKSTGGVLKPLLMFQHLVLVAFIVILMGILFGLYPALKASRMNPIEALRYE